MPAPNAPAGTPSRRAREHNPTDPGNKHNHPGASSPQTTAPPPTTQESSVFDIEALNPPFDSRMRRIGSPLNQTSLIKRGWIQDKEGTKRVNFLYNPSQLDLTHATDANVPLEENKPNDDPFDADYASTASHTSVKLLYDRTYELFSPPKDGKIGFANKYGVWADIAAWYTYLQMIPEYPTSWEDSLITEPPHKFFSYLFVGPTMCYYGYIDSIGVTYSHWSQNMVPIRGAVDIGFQIMPFNPKTNHAPVPGQSDSWSPFDGWLNSFNFIHIDNPNANTDDGDGDVTPPDWLPGPLGGDD